MVGMPGHEKAKNWLIKNIKGYDKKSSGKLSVINFTPDAEEAKRFYQKDFDEKVEGKISKVHPDYQKWLKFTSYMKGIVDKYKSHEGTNIVWEKQGIDTSKILLITAHYDTISHDPTSLLITETKPMPGANFNASGVAVALALIKNLAQIDLNYSVQVVFLDWQGIGFLGSYEYAKLMKDKAKNIMGVINLEMLGQDTSFMDKAKKTGNMSVYFRPEDENFVKQLNKHGEKITSKITFEMKPQGFDNSDNVRFWEQGIIAATYSQNWEDDFNPKFYQTPQDTPETLNHETLYHAYQYLGGAVMGILLDITK